MNIELGGLLALAALMIGRHSWLEGLREAVSGR